MSQPVIISRQEAQAAGLKRYFTGLPCVRGHVAERYLATYICVECTTTRTVERTADYYHKYREQKAEYNLRNQARRKAARARYYKANREDELLKMAKWNESNRERSNSLKAAYAKRNPSVGKASVHARRARLVGAVGRHTAADINAIIKAQNGKCPYCKRNVRKHYHVDHITPLAKGGSNGRDNIQVTCGPCNRKKGAKHPVDFAQSIGLLI